MKILAINFGSTSSKYAVFDIENEIIRESFQHSANEIQSYSNIFDQEPLRKTVLDSFLKKNTLSYEDFDCIITRGGHWQPVPSGIFEISEEMIEDLKTGKWGIHAADVGVIMAYNIGKAHDIPVISADTAITDEFQSLARYSGINEIQRISSFHVLNHKAVARRYAESTGKNYYDLNLIVVHLGGGISIAAHKSGKMIDANNALDGDGPFSPERSGGLPVGDLVKLCFSGEFSYEEISKKIQGKGGLMSYLGTNDVLEVERRIQSGDEFAKEVFDAMIYQVAKTIGSMSVVLKGEVDQILLTGSIANSQYLVNSLFEYVNWISEITVYPGEDEMQSMAENARRYLNKEQEPLNYLEFRK